MMSGGCAGSEERLVALLYDDGDAAELAQTRAHLATCAPCRQEFEELASTRGLLAAWPDVVNVPRVIYVGEVPRSGRDPEGARGRRWGVFRPFLPALAAAAGVALVFLVSVPFLRFHADADGSLRVGFGTSSGASVSRSELVTRSDLDQGLAQTARYVEELVRSGREQDRQAVLDAVAQALRDQDDAVGDRVASALNAALDEVDRRRRGDLGVVLSSMNDLQVITRTELQRLNAMLASLTPAPDTDKE
jgi:anti-sigma factor RsiW